MQTSAIAVFCPIIPGKASPVVFSGIFFTGLRLGTATPNRTSGLRLPLAQIQGGSRTFNLPLAAQKDGLCTVSPT